MNFKVLGAVAIFGVILLAIFMVDFFAAVSNETPFPLTVLNNSAESDYTEDLQSKTVSESSYTEFSVPSADNTFEDYVNPVVNESVLDCPEIEQFYGKCIEDLSPFQQVKAKDALKKRIEAEKRGLDWRNIGGSSGGSGGGSGGGSAAAQSSSAFTPNDSSENSSENNSSTSSENVLTAVENNTHYSYFMSSKIANYAACVGCTETFLDLDSSAVANVTPNIDVPDSVTNPRGLHSTSKRTYLIEAGSDEELAQVIANVRAVNGSVDFASAIGNVVVAKIPAQNISYLENTQEITSISEDAEVEILSLPPIVQEYPEAESFGYTGKGVRVAVIDTGIDSSNKMLSGRIVAEADFSGEGTPADLHGHGTHLAGIIAGSTENGGAYNGIAPDAELINAKALSKNGSGKISSILKAISFSLNPDSDIYTDDGARIINLSFGAKGDFSGSALESAIKDAVSAGAVVVASAGNCGSDSPDLSCSGFTGLTFPGSMKEILTVGSTGKDKYYSLFSSHGYVSDYGVKPDIVALGENVLSSWKGGSLKSESGTSVSAAFVSGAAALLIEKNPLLSPYELKNILLSSATDLGSEGADELYGYGLLDIQTSLDNVDSVATGTIVIVSPSTEITVGTADAPLEAKLRIYNSTDSPIFISDSASESWVRVSYPMEIPSLSSSLIYLNVDQASLGAGYYESEILFAANDYLISHTLALNVVQGSTGFNSNQEFEINVSTPVSIAVSGVSGSSNEVARGRTITITPRYNKPGSFNAGNYYSTLLISGPSNYACDTSYQKYYHSTGSKDVPFTYTIPENAPLGNYNVKAFNYTACSGNGYDNTCHSNDYSCNFSGSWENEYLKTNAFKVVQGCNTGVCCNSASGTFKSLNTVCKSNTNIEYSCTNPEGKGGAVQVRYLDVLCSGSSSDCSGSEKWGEWQTKETCDYSEVCDASQGKCVPDPITCYKDSDCGISGWSNTPFCSSSTVKQEYKTYSCSNAGTLQSSCSSSTEIRDKIQCNVNAGQICADAACITPGDDKCSDSQVGKSWCENNRIASCYFDPSDYTNQLKYESCRIGVCESTGTTASCNVGENQFSIGIDAAPLGLPVFKQPGDKVRVNILSTLSEQQTVSLEYDISVLSPVSGNCNTGEKLVSKGSNYCDFIVSENARREPTYFQVSNVNGQSSRMINVALPQTIIITNSDKLKLRYSKSERIDSLMQDLYQKAFENQGVVYDLASYEDVVGKNPFAVFSSYPSLKSDPKVNDYVSKVASFTSSKCPQEYCKHILIVGDDYVVPMWRETVSEITDNGIQENHIYLDSQYVPKTTKSIGDADEFFQKYMVNGIAFVVPDNLSAELRASIDSFKEMLNNKYGISENWIQEYKSSEIYCNVSNSHPLNGKTVVLFGTRETNHVFSCVRASDSTGDLFAVYRSPWGDFGDIKASVLVVHTDSPEIVELSSYLVEKGLIRSRDITTIEFLNDGISVCDTAGWIPIGGELGDLCAVGLSCYVNGSEELSQLEDNDAGYWCSVNGLVVLALPWAGGKIFKYASKAGFTRAAGRFGANVVEDIVELAVKRGGKTAERSALKAFEITSTLDKKWSKESVTALEKIVREQGEDSKVVRNIIEFKDVEGIDYWVKDAGRNIDLPEHRFFELESASYLKSKEGATIVNLGGPISDSGNQGYKISAGKYYRPDIFALNTNQEKFIADVTMVDSLGIKNIKDNPAGRAKWLSDEVDKKLSGLRDAMGTDIALINVKKLKLVLPKSNLEETIVGNDTLEIIMKKRIAELYTAGSYPFEVEILGVV